MFFKISENIRNKILNIDNKIKNMLINKTIHWNICCVMNIARSISRQRSLRIAITDKGKHSYQGGGYDKRDEPGV